VTVAAGGCAYRPRGFKLKNGRAAGCHDFNLNVRAAPKSAADLRHPHGSILRPSQVIGQKWTGGAACDWRRREIEKASKKSGANHARPPTDWRGRGPFYRMWDFEGVI